MSNAELADWLEARARRDTIFSEFPVEDHIDWMAAQALREADELYAEMFEEHGEMNVQNVKDEKQIEKLQARINALEGALREIALDSTNPTNQRSYAAERAEQALQDKD